MPNLMTSLGFPVASEEDFYHFATQAVEQGEPLDVGTGTYLKWSTGNGIELWAQLDRNDVLVGLNPHFTGLARLTARLMARVLRAEGTELDGAFHAWADPDEENPEGVYPFVFDTPDYSTYEALSLPVIADLQLTAFAHQLKGYPSEADYYEAQSGEIKFASESFIPEGLFEAAQDGNPAPEAQAFFTGCVEDAAAITNPATGVEFYWARVRTLGGVIDVVADPEVLEGPLVTGGTITGSFWLSGRLVTR